MSKIKVLLTGGGGMVGRNLLDHPFIKDFEIIAPRSRELNLCDYSAVQAYLRKHRPEMIVHAAGKVGGIQANMRTPISFLMENLDMGRNIVWGARENGIKLLLNIGSSCMYPRNYSESLSEEMILKGEFEPTNEGYALAKVVTARLCDYIRHEDADYKYKTIIPCNLYGCYDNFDPVRSHLIPAIIHKIHLAKNNESSFVEIWGDGTARREFMFAGDLADAIVRAMKYFDSVPDYMNIGMGYDFKIEEYYNVVAETLGYKGGFIHDITKPVGMSRKLVSVARQKRWGWKASHDLRLGIKKTYDHYLKEMNQ